MKQNEFIFKHKLTFFFIFQVLIILSSIKNTSERVCSLKDLRMEIIEDIKFNKHLSCLKDIRKFEGLKETEEAKNNRIKARWDSTCSGDFNTEDVMKYLKKYHNIESLVDIEGHKIPGDPKEEALLCIMIRTLVANNVYKIRDLDMKSLRAEDFVNKIDCPGDGPPEHKICMVNATGAFYNISAFLPMLEPNMIKFANRPQAKLNNEEDDKTPDHKAHKHLDISKYPKLAKDLIEKARNGELANNGGAIANDLNKMAAEMQQGNNGNNTNDNVFDPKGPNSGNNPNNANRSPKAGGSGAGGSPGQGGAAGGEGGNPNAALSSGGAYFKVNDGPVVLETTEELKQTQIPVLNFETGGPNTVFAFNMIAFTQSINQNVSFKMQHDGALMPSSKVMTAEKSTDSLTGAYIDHVLGNGFPHGTVTYYTSSLKLPITPDGNENNFSQGAILFNKTNIFIGSNPAPINLKSNQSFQPVQGGKLQIRNNNVFPTEYLLFYNFPCRHMGGPAVLSAIVKGQNKDLEGTLSTKSHGTLMTPHGAQVVKLGPNEIGDYILNYRLQSDAPSECSIDLEEGGRGLNSGIVLMGALELKKENVIKVPLIPNNLFNDDNRGTWTKFSINHKETYGKQTNILVLFHYNIFVDGALFSIRLTINGRPARRSLLTNKEHRYASGQGYVLEHLDPGRSYVYDLEYKTSAQKPFQLGSEENVLFMQIIQLA